MKYTNEFWNEVSKRYLQEQISLTKLGKEYNIDRRTLSKKFKDMGIDIINRTNMLKFNDLVFDTIDTEEKAYWLGFIFADGYISNTNSVYKNVFELSLKLLDIEHLYKFNKFMEHSDINHVKHDSYRCRWCIMNKHLWNTLNNYGCTPNKSLSLSFPDKDVFKNSQLIRHFIRGYFDGDGSITFYKYVHTVSPHILLIGTKSFLQKIINVSLIPANIRHDKRHSNSTFSLEYSKEDGIKFINWLYNDCHVYLNRKYKLYNFFKNGSRSLQEWNELLSTKNGEVWDGNTVVTEETKKSFAPYSVETEPDLSE